MDCSLAGMLLDHFRELYVDSMEEEMNNILFLGACGCLPFRL